MPEKPKKDEIIERYDFKPVPDMENAPPRVYANGAMIIHSNIDFTLVFYDSAPPLGGKVSDLEKVDENTFKLEAPVVARIVLTPSIMELVVEAMQKNLQRYKELVVKGDECDGTK